MNNRSPSHRRLKARQNNFRGSPTANSFTIPDNQATSLELPTQTLSDNQPTASPTSSTTSTQQPPPTTTSTHNHATPTTTSITHQLAEPTSTTTSAQQSSSTSTSTSSTSSSSSSSSSSLSSSAVPSSTTSKVAPTTVILTTAPVTYTQKLASLTPVTTAALTSVSASTTAVASGGISTGAIVGSVAGGIAGIVAIFMIVAFFLRRWRRNRITEEDFNPDEFVRSPNMAQTPGSYNDNPFEPTPPNAAFRAGHNVAPSISSGPNMAGQGAYAYGSDAAPYSDAAYAAGGVSYGAGAAGGAAYGTYDHATADDAINGAYSSQPQVQAPYNAEAYGSFAYSTEGPHAVTTPSQQFHPYSSQEYQAHYHDNAPALVAGAPAVAANRGRVPSIIDPEDAYGGI